MASSVVYVFELRTFSFICIMDLSDKNFENKRYESCCEIFKDRIKAIQTLRCIMYQ